MISYIAVKNKAHRLDFMSSLWALYDLYFTLPCDLPRSLNLSLLNKIPIMAHLAAD